jgi:uncharacterized protein DUF6745
LVKIETLTADQERQLAAFRERWLKIGRSTEPSDRAKAEAAISKFYSWLGEKQPYFWRCDGPATGSIFRAILAAIKANLAANFWANLWANLKANFGENLEATLWANIRVNLWSNLAALWTNLGPDLQANLGENLEDDLRYNLAVSLEDDLAANLRANLAADLQANLRASLQANLQTSLRDNLMANLGANFWALGTIFKVSLKGTGLKANVLESFGANLWANLDWRFRGQHEAYWFAYYFFPHSCLREMHTAEQIRKVQCWLDLSESCGWWQPLRGVVFICERPLKQAVDERGRLHCADGPALLCRDGWPVYAWHNVRVPEDVITKPDAITVERILKERNGQVRAVMVERYGFERFMIDCKPKQLDRCGEYRLVSMRASGEARDGDVMTALIMTCPSTGAHYVHGVHPACQTIGQALAWKRGEDLHNHKFVRQGDVYLIDLNEETETYNYGDNCIWES